MKSIIHFSAILLGLLISADAFSQNKLDVRIYYESLCPDCKKFFSKQLVPNYEPFKEYINITYVPFGNARSLNTSDGVTFICQHGEDECKQNILQACTLHFLKNRPDSQMKYTVCQMKSSDPIGRTCVKAVKRSFTKVRNCMSGELGIRLQLEMERETKAVRRFAGTPTVTINYANVDVAITHFRRTLCYSLVIKPELCDDL